MLHTNNCRSQHSTNHIIKYSDATSLLSLLTQDSDISIYKSEMVEVVKWCEEHNLLLNVKNTKEIIFDPWSVSNHSHVLINQDEVEQVTTLKYSGLYIDFKLRWDHRVEHVCWKINHCILRRLRLHDVDKSIMLLFYWASIESIKNYGITIWFCNLPVKFKSQLKNVIERAGKIICMHPPSSLQKIFEEAVRRQGRKITCDPNHIFWMLCKQICLQRL